MGKILCTFNGFSESSAPSQNEVCCPLRALQPRMRWLSPLPFPREHRAGRWAGSPFCFSWLLSNHFFLFSSQILAVGGHCHHYMLLLRILQRNRSNLLRQDVLFRPITTYPICNICICIYLIIGMYYIYICTYYKEVAHVITGAEWS